MQNILAGLIEILIFSTWVRKTGLFLIPSFIFYVSAFVIFYVVMRRELESISEEPLLKMANSGS